MARGATDLLLSSPGFECPSHRDDSRPQFSNSICPDSVIDWLDQITLGSQLDDFFEFRKSKY